MNVAASAGEFLVNREGGERSRFMGGGAELVAEVLESLDPERLGLRVRAGLASQLSKIELAPLLGNLLENLIADGRHRPLLDGLIRWAGLTLEDNEEAVREIIRNRANSVLRWTGLDSRISSSVLDGIYRLLAEVLVDPDHPMRGKIDAALIKLAVQLKTDPDMQAKVEAMKMDLLENPALADWWMGVWERMRRSLIARARSEQRTGQRPARGSARVGQGPAGRSAPAEADQPLRPPHGGGHDLALRRADRRPGL